jgi:hypothetical protein
VLVQQQCLAVIAVAQLVQRLRMQMAVQAGVDAFDVSLPLLLEVLPEKQEPETSCQQVTPSKTATAKKREKKKDESALQAAREEGTTSSEGKDEQGRRREERQQQDKQASRREGKGETAASCKEKGASPVVWIVPSFKL